MWLAVTLVVLAAPYAGLLDESWTHQLILVALLALIVSGLNISFGHAGELSFASAAMYGAGAYVSGYLAMEVLNDFALALVVSAVVGLLLGLLTGVPGLRLGGWMLAVASFFLVLLVPDVVQIFSEQTGGNQGMSGIPLPELFGFELGDTGLYVVTVLVTSAWFALFRNLVVSRLGRSLTVLRESPVLASSLGISVFGLKLKAYALSGLPAAMAGTIFAYLNGFNAPGSFGIELTMAVLTASILGGSRSVYGVFLGAAVMQLGPMRTTAFGDYALIAYGVLLVIVGVLIPGGIVGLVRRRRRTAQPATTAAGQAEATARLTMPGRRLEVSGVSKDFGGVRALTGAGFVAGPGEVVALIGPNGSGKTTLLNLISGFYRVDAGTVRLDGVTVSGRPAAAVARAGVRRTFQTPLIPGMSVREVVASGRFSLDRAGIVATVLRLPRYRRALRRDRAAADEMLAAAGLSGVAAHRADALPLGTRRVVELARALAGEPAVLLLDEAASGLDEKEVAALAALVRAVRDGGGTVVLVEHDFGLVRSLADRVVVLSQGQVVTEGTPAEIAVHPEVLQHYLGAPGGVEARA